MGTEPTAKFNTHENYLRAFAQSAGFDYLSSADQVLSKLASTVRETSLFRSAQRASAPDLEQVHKSLANAWGMELLLGVGGEVATDPELLGLVNAQGVVQTYYAAYHATQALAVARGGRRVESHPATQKQFASHWGPKSFDLLPWTLAVTGDGYRGLPFGHTVDPKVHSWAACGSDSCVDLACKALRTTRDAHVDEALKKAREQKKKEARRQWHTTEEARLRAGRSPRKVPEFALPRLLPAERAKVESGVRPFTLIDYLYRLRIGAQYVDPSTFTEGADLEYESRGVHRDLVRIVASTLLVHEIFIATAIGPSRLARLVDGWLNERHPAGRGHLGLARRRSMIAPLTAA